MRPSGYESKVFEFTTIVTELLGHFVGPARHIAIDCGPKGHGLTDLEFMRGHRTPPRLPVPPRVRLYASSHSILDRKEIM